MIKAITRFSSNGIQVFKEIVNFLESQGIDSTELENNLNNAEVQFIRGLRTKPWNTDKDACLELYSAPRSKNYNKLKGHLKQKLLTMAISNYSCPSGYNSDLDIVYKKFHQDFIVYRSLHSKNYTIASSYLGELLVAKSIECGFSDFVIQVSTELIEHFSISRLNPSKVKYYCSVLEEYTQTIVYEKKATLTYSKMMNLFILELSPEQKATSAIADKFLKDAEKMVGKLNSTRFHLRFYLIKIFNLYNLNKFTEMDLISKEAISYFSNFKYRRLRTENMFLKKRVEANLILGNISICKKLLLNVLENSIKGDVNWFNTLEIISKIQLHEKQYDESARTFLTGKQSNRFGTIPKITAQRWGLLEAYINFLHLSGATKEAPTMSRYRINKFINETPQYSADKKGRNIQLIIAQLLFYIVDKNWAKLEEKMEALRKYSTRHLRKSELFRSQVFIKMLLEIPKRMYHPDAIIRHTAKYKKRLEEMAPNIEMNGSGLEIIPYEDLWELIIQNIVPPKYSRKSKQAAK